jgi:hypothetical protein
MTTAAARMTAPVDAVMTISDANSTPAIAVAAATAAAAKPSSLLCLGCVAAQLSSCSKLLLLLLVLLLLSSGAWKHHAPVTSAVSSSISERLHQCMFITCAQHVSTGVLV